MYVHELVHALLFHTAGLPNRGEWLQEGLASWYQARFHGQADLHQVLQQRLAHGLPLGRLCDGAPIELVSYGEALLVVGTLLEAPRWAGTLEATFAQAARTGLSALSERVDLEALDTDRQRWAARRFAW